MIEKAMAAAATNAQFFSFFSPLFFSKILFLLFLKLKQKWKSWKKMIKLEIRKLRKIINGKNEGRTWWILQLAFSEGNEKLDSFRLWYQNWCNIYIESFGKIIDWKITKGIRAYYQVNPTHFCKSLTKNLKSLGSHHVKTSFSKFNISLARTNKSKVICIEITRMHNTCS